MRPAPPRALLDRIERWAALSRWERAEVGRALRRPGWSYGEIRAVIDVPEATLAGWCRDITLRPEQIAAIERRADTRRGVPRDTQRKRRLKIARIEADAREFAAAHLHDPLFAAGTTLCPSTCMRATTTRRHDDGGPTGSVWRTPSTRRRSSSRLVQVTAGTTSLTACARCVCDGAQTHGSGRWRGSMC